MKRILIINAHSSKNKGDAAIIISMIQSIRKHTPNSEIIISSRYPKDDDLYKYYGCNVVEQITRYPEKQYSFIKRLLFMFKELKEVNNFVSNRKIPLSRNKDIFEQYKNADVIVSCGGGFIYSNSKYSLEASLIMHLSQIYFAKKMNKKLVIYSQSIGPFKSKLSKFIVEKVLKNVDLITVREDLSQMFLKDIGINFAEIVSDSAFVIETNQIDSNKLIELDINKNNIGVTVRQWEFPNKKDKYLLYSSYIQSVARAIEYVVENYNSIVYIVPQVTGPTKIEDDRVSSEHVWNELNDTTKKSVVLLKEDYSPEELKAIYSKFDMFIGTRMHSNIFSLSSFVPTVAISYEPKTTGIMKMLNLSQYVSDINTIEARELINKVQLAWKNKTQYRLCLEQQMPSIKLRAEEPAIKISQLIS